MSQLELGLRAGVSQRHVSWIETCRAKPSRPTLLALLDALDAPLVDRNAVLLAAGLAPQYSALSLDDPALAPARDALNHLIHGPAAAPALVREVDWNLLMANAGVARQLQLMGVALPERANVLELLLAPEGLRRFMINEAEVCAEVLHRARRESLHVPGLTARLASLSLPDVQPVNEPTPLLFTRLRSSVGELRLLSMFSTFGSPLDVNLASLRIEHLFPADAATSAALSPAGAPSSQGWCSPRC